MRNAGRQEPARSAGRTPGHISVAFLAGVSLVPLVIATGFLTDRGMPGDAPADITRASLRGSLEQAHGTPHLRGSYGG